MTFEIVILSLLGVFLVISYYLIWAMDTRIGILQDRLGQESQRLNDLKEKVKNGEHATMENFLVLQKGLQRLHNEIKGGQKTKENIKAAKIKRASAQQ